MKKIFFIAAVFAIIGIEIRTIGLTIGLGIGLVQKVPFPVIGLGIIFLYGKKNNEICYFKASPALLHSK